MNHKCKVNHDIPIGFRPSDCKECKKLYRKQYREKLKTIYPDKYERMLDNVRKYKKTSIGKVSVLKNTLKRAKLYPEKKRAHDMVFWELEAGRMQKKPCCICGSIKSEAHHPDYSKPLDVIWVCRIHHSQIHLNKI